MLCEKCGKNVATTHIRSVVNGNKTERHLCAVCAAAEGVGTFGDTGLGDMLASMFGDVLAINPASAKVRCDCCGSTFADISKTGKAGCPACYKTFYNELLPYLKRVHGSVKHIGKAPGATEQKVPTAADELSKLKQELKKLVSEEKFEQAAQIRDKIKEMEAGL